MTSLPCPPGEWTRFSALLDQAMELPELDRGAWLAGLANNDAGLRPWLARVLGADAATGTGFLRPGAPLEGGFSAGDTVGPYRLEASLGVGGMGEVWRARRLDDGPRREVALKLPHAELLGGPFRQRFARERDVLAALSHPHIAQLYDAGLSAQGHPYLALELVGGQQITDACRNTGASLDRRVALVREILDALSYAHQRLIVHRDIKPSNVLVTPDGGVKLLDFGIAKLLRPTETQDAMLTQAAARLATPAYAAPEQFSDGTITVGTDLFSVGVLLFELCTGHRPFNAPPIGPRAEAAPLASQRADAAAAGMSEGKSLTRQLRGDMDAVIARALALEPAERYSSAEAFARDLKRCREGLPVSARRIGWPALAQKFVLRNKVGVGLAAVLALALAGGTLGIAWQARRAEREAARATAIKDFLIGLFEKGDARGGGKAVGTMTAKELLDAGADRADAAFGRDPATEIDLLETLGNVYDVLSERERSEQVWSRRLELMRALYGPSDRRVMDGVLQLSSSEVEFQDEDRSLALLDSIRQPIFARYGAESVQRAQWLTARARSLRITHGGRDEAIADDLAAIAIFEKYFPAHPAYPDTLNDLADYQYDGEQYAESLASIEKSRQVEISVHQYDAMDELEYHTDIADRLERLGRLADAENQYQLAEQQAERLVGKDSLWYMHALISRAQMASLHGERERSESMLRDAMAISQRHATVTGLATSLKRVYGSALAREGKAAEGVPFLEDALAGTKLHLRDEPNLRRTEEYLGIAYDMVGRTAEARVLLRAARDEWIKYGPPAATQTLGARERWGRFLLEQGETAPAAAEFQAVLDQGHGRPTAQAALAEAGLARIAAARGAASEADAHSARALQLLAATTLEYDVRSRIDVWLARAESLAAGGRHSEARDWVQKAVAAAAEYDAPESPELARARAMLQEI